MSEESAQLYEEAQRRLREVTTLYEASQACLSISDQKGLLTAIIEAAARATDAALGSVMLTDEDKGEYVFGAHYGLSEETIATIEAELHIPLGEGLVGAVVTAGQPLVVADVTTDPRWIPSQTKELMCSFLGVPLLGRDRQPLGALNLARPDVGAFDEDHARLLSTFANQAAMAIENARLYEQAQQEIAERKRAEEALRESEKRYRSLVQQSKDAIFQMSLDGTIVFASPACQAIFGYSPEEFVADPGLTARIVHPDYPTQFDDFWQQYHTNGVFPEQMMEWVWIRKDGQTVYTENLFTSIFDEQGNIIGFQTVARDITERKQAEEAYRTLVEHSLQGLVVIQDFHIVFANSAFAEICGYTVEELLSLSPEEVRAMIHPEDQALVWGRMRDRLAGKPVPPRYEYRGIRKDGSVCWLEMVASRIEYRGKPAVQGAIADITERRRAEEALRESEERFRQMAELSPFPVSIIDPAGRYEYVNPKFIKVFGYTLEDIPNGKEWFAQAYPDPVYRQEVVSAWLSDLEQFGEYEVRPRTFNVTCKDRTVREILFRPVTMKDGRQFIIYEDITERKRAEEQLRQAQKMEAIGQLAGGLAHDFNNLLTPIGGFAELLMWKTPEDSQQYEYLRQIKVAAERATTLTSQLLALAQRAQVEVRPLNLNDVVHEVIGLLERTIDKAIAIEPHLADDLATVEGDAGQLHQVLLNLCLNARDAMPDGGLLTIETQNVTLSEEEARTELDLEAGQYVLLNVTDTGRGMDAETQQRLFEPFFTTKEQGRGLGLAMVYGIVRGHRGAIRVYSQSGQGSTFKVYLPVASRPAEDTGPKEAEAVGGSETVLVVDDEEPVRALLQRILEEGGYTVLLATDGIEALELYAERGTEIDLVVLDIIMPRMGGRKTYERLREINPEVKVLLTSGYSEDGQAQDILAVGARGFLQKPYDLRAVLGKVREVLED